MKIVFSRQAKRRAKLYKIEEHLVLDILRQSIWKEGKHEIVQYFDTLKYPLKIVFSVEHETITLITVYPLKKRESLMNIHYDNEVDALYLQLSSIEPDGVIEISEGINIDTAENSQLIGIEILDASLKLDLNTIFFYNIECDRLLLTTYSETLKKLVISSKNMQLPD